MSVSRGDVVLVDYPFSDRTGSKGGATGLRQNSMIQCENLLTYDQRLIISKIGQLSTPLMQSEKSLPYE